MPLKAVIHLRNPTYSWYWINASNSPSCPNAKVFVGLETIFGLYGSSIGISTLRRGPNISKNALSIDSLGFSLIKLFFSNLWKRYQKHNEDKKMFPVSPEINYPLDWGTINHWQGSRLMWTVSGRSPGLSSFMFLLCWKYVSQSCLDG